MSAEDDRSGDCVSNRGVIFAAILEAALILALAWWTKTHPGAIGL
jgi:hypothetical protein